MLSSVITLLAGVLFGLALAAPPGPMNAVIAEESVLRGWTAGFGAGLGAMLADVLFFLLTLAGLVTVVDSYPAIRPALYLVGGALMCYFAADAVAEARTTEGFAAGVDPDGKGFRKTFALSLSNPYQIGFWVTVGVGLLEPGTIDVLEHVPGASTLAADLVVRTGSPALVLGFFAGIAVWIVVYPAALVAAGRRVDALAPVVAALSGVVLALFGLAFLALGLAEIG